MTPTDVYILHLSDLHISNGVINRTLSSLLSDITGQLIGVRKLIIAVTGDIISNADYEMNGGAAREFFERLKNNIPTQCEVLTFAMVPGNHDVIRPGVKTDYNAGTYLPSSDSYESLQEYVSSLFGKASRSTYGVSEVVVNSRTIRIVRSGTPSKTRLN